MAIKPCDCLDALTCGNKYTNNVNQVLSHHIYEHVSVVVAQDGRAGPDSQLIHDASFDSLHPLSCLQLPEGRQLCLTLLAQIVSLFHCCCSI